MSMTDPVFKLYAICSAVLTIQLLLLAIMTGARRGKYKSYLNPEDSPQKSDGGDHPEVARVSRAHRNSIENILPFFGIGLLFAMTGQNPLVAQILIGTFTGARVIHSIAYIAGKQPFRTLSFLTGVLTLLAMSAMVILKAF